MNTLLQMFGLCLTTEYDRLERENQEYNCIVSQKDNYIKELKANSTDLFEQNQRQAKYIKELEAANNQLGADIQMLKGDVTSLTETIKHLNDKLDKKNYFANIRKMGNMKQTINRLTAELNKYRNQ